METSTTKYMVAPASWPNSTIGHKVSFDHCHNVSNFWSYFLLAHIPPPLWVISNFKWFFLSVVNCMPNCCLPSTVDFMDLNIIFSWILSRLLVIVALTRRQWPVRFSACSMVLVDGLVGQLAQPWKHFKNKMHYDYSFVGCKTNLRTSKS